MNPLIVLRSGYITKLKLKVHITYKKPEVLHFWFFLLLLSYAKSSYGRY